MSTKTVAPNAATEVIPDLVYVVIPPLKVGGRKKYIPHSLQEAKKYQRYMKQQWDIDIKIVKTKPQ